jgi:hypothetical protein
MTGDNKHTIRYPESMKQRALELFSDGMKATTLSFMYGTSLSTIRKWAQEKGIKVHKKSNLSEISGEIWTPIKDYEGLYEVSNFGRVKSLPRVGNQYTEAIKKHQLSTPGYPCVMLSKDGEFNVRTIHRLVAVAYIPNPLNLKYVNHKNGIKTDFSIDNLEWSTKRDDILHAIRTGLRVSKKMGENHQAKRISCFDEYGDLVKEYGCAREAAEINGYTHQCITYAARNGKKSYGLYWKYI